MIAALQNEFSRSQTIPFSRFMELALHAPREGYYERKQEVIGPRGDFYTSVSAGPLFAELLAYQLASWLREVQGPQINLVEAGAYDGTLARGILRGLADESPAFFSRIIYSIVEPSEQQRHRQERTLEHFAGQVRWVGDLKTLSQDHLSGVIFSNELLDAMPVRRISWDASAGIWFEWGVTRQEGGLAWARMELNPVDRIALFDQAALPCPPELEQVLPDGFTLDLSPAATQWWSEAARSLKQGWLMTFDYGLTPDEFWSTSRGHGTLRGYENHRVTADVLTEPGTRDLTAHVNFGALQRAGEAEGLVTEGLFYQEQYLGGLARRNMEQRPHWWTSARRAHLQTLIHPEHLGRPFRVLVQRRGGGA